MRSNRTRLFVFDLGLERSKNNRKKIAKLFDSLFSWSVCFDGKTFKFQF